MAMPFLDQFVLWVQSPIGIITMCGLLGVAVYFIISRVLNRGEEEFKTEMFEDAVKTDLDDKFKVEGIKSRGSLVQGFDYLGSIDRWIRVKGSFKKLIYDPKKERYMDASEIPKKKQIKDVTPYDLYIFRIWKTNAIFKFFGFGERKYIVVEDKHISNISTVKDTEQWNLKKDVEFTRWANIFITSQAGEEYISDIAIKRSHENTLTYLMNYARKIIYLEFQHSKNMDRYATKKKIDKKAWSDYKRASDIEDENEDE